LTARVGKHCPGAAQLLCDVLDKVMHERKSLLLIGMPGAGKTTMLREIASLLARPYGDDGDYRHNVIVIDKSNEIAGDGDEPHPAIGNAVRHQVGSSVFVQVSVSVRRITHFDPKGATQ
jgi:stage III sporulation protein SpoIIIAA